MSTLLLMASQRFEFVLLGGVVDGDGTADNDDDVSCTSSSSDDCSFFWNIVIDFDFSMTKEAERADAASRLPDIVCCEDSISYRYS